MISKYQMMMGLLLFNFMLFPLVATSITMPNVTNPISDLVPGFAGSATGTGSGTMGCATTNAGASFCGGAQGDTIIPGQQNIQSCLVGAGTGALTGALVGTIVPGIGNIAGAIGGAILGGFAGCGIASTFFPAAGSAIFTTAANSLGPLGDFAKTLVIALGWVGPVLKFFQDSVFYEFALLANAPEIGVWLFPFQALAAAMLLFVGAEYVRGTGIGG